MKNCKFAACLSSLPWKSLISILSVLYSFVTFTGAGVFGLFLFLHIAFRTDYWWLAVLYAFWLIFDYSTPEFGGRRSQWVREWAMWRYQADYYPAKLHKTENLSPEFNYILGFHPHGISASGAFLHFATEATGFGKLFPFITPYLCINKIQFQFPFSREYVLSTSCISVSRASIEHVTGGSQGYGNLAVIITGGAREAMDAHPGQYKIFLKSRKGFIKIALRTGSHLIPCISFGENSYYKQVNNAPGTWLRNFQVKMNSIVGFTLPLFYGFGLLPLSTPINTVVGKPIPVNQTDFPSDEEVDELSKTYIAALVDLFREYKPQFDPTAKDIEII